MSEPIQRRARATRANLIAAAESIVAREGFGGLRVEQVVKAAGVAKGTFFTHFADKDVLMEQLVAKRLSRLMDALQTARRPSSAKGLAATLGPVIELLTCERYVFDLVQRASLADGPIAEALSRLDIIITGWFGGLFGAPPFRTDLPPKVMAEGIRAFTLMAMARHVARPGKQTEPVKALATQVEAYLMPPK
ncbi:TetR/AcrR family transcriptional regulator [Vannielia litorea]|uniref:TetR/AcrR family transcriptional regulator n=1 Tax=Vannielia litorea TaxID=1217970 RepID=UPI001C942598|nr:TetR/AcrR family transcriptional regulator [Vannielia litorea]MBY6047049.1 TetR/AcrR family transcriptional regulator [Vannielia litorea]MBY6074463.1 TetR/AcrR family transcriptional regulator [Vannielia litorea]